MSEKVIGGPIDSGVIAQIKLREDVYSSNKRREDPQVLQFMNSRTGWVKFQSSVNVNRSSKLAQDYILIGGVLGRTGIDTYRNYPNGLGFRPMPGITGVQVTSINRFGLLKEATVSINCWDLKQLEDLEQLYMRPGYTALLEWGHSMYYNNGNTGTLQSIPRTLEGYFSGGISKQEIYNRIKVIKQNTSYNYDGIFAFIKNFSWSYRSDGGYDCTVNLMSIGEIIESLTVCIDSTSLGDKAASNVDNTTPPLPTLLQNVLKIIKDKGVDSWTQLTTDLPNFTGKFGEVSGLGTINVQSLPLSSIVTQKEQLPGTEQKFSFLKMDTFCAMINTVLLVENNKAGIVRLSTQKNASNTYRNYSQHVSSDPGICLIVTPSVDTWLAPIPFSGGGNTGFEFLGSISTAGNDIFNTQTTSTILEELRQGQSDQASDEILNIWLNVDFIASEIDKLVQSPPDQRTLVNLMNPILSQINEALGGINELALHYEEESFTWYIVDRSVQVEKSHALSLINLVGLRSTVSEVSLVTKLPKDITTMMAISAQANAADLGIETGALLQWNKGLTDRIIKTKSVNLDKVAEDESSLNEKTQAILSEQMFIVRTFLNNIFNNGQYNYDEAAAARIAYGQYTTTYLQYYEDSGATSKNNSGAAGIIPFDLNITMDGISGIKIGQAFKIPGASILPPKYENKVGFIVTGVDHDITANRWTTKLKAQVILLDKASKSKVTAKLYERKIIIRQNNDDDPANTPNLNFTRLSSPAGTFVTIPAFVAIKNFISGPESAGRYGVANTGGRKGRKELKESSQNVEGMPISVMRYFRKTNTANGIPWGDKRLIFAAGRYQFVPDTLLATLPLAGLTTKDSYTKENQEKLMDALFLSLTGVSAYVKGTNEGTFAQLSTAVQSIGKCWASMPIIRRKNGTVVGDVVTGVGNVAFYGGDGLNPSKVKTSIRDVASLVVKTRIDYSKKSPKDIPTYYNL